MSVQAPDTIDKHPSESLTIPIDFTGLLQSGETLSGTPTIAVISGAGLTIATPAVVATAYTKRNGNSIAVGKGVTLVASSGTVGVTYRVQATCSTTDGNTRIGDVLILVSRVVGGELLVKQPGESIKYAIDLTAFLHSGETLSTLTSILEVTTAALTLTEKAINTTALTKRDPPGGTIAIGKGLQVRVVGGADGTTYRICWIAVTSLGDTRARDVLLKVVD